MKTVLVLLLASLTSVAFADDMKGMKTLTETFSAAWNKHDPKGMTKIFTDDAELINPMGRVAKGKAEIEKLFTDEQSTLMKGTKFDLKLESMKVVDGLALCDGTATVTGMMGPDGKKMDKMPHHAFWVAQKSGNSWQVVALRPYMFVTPPPANEGAKATH